LNRRECYRAQYPWLNKDDLLAAARLGFAEALSRFNPAANNGLNAFARHYVDRGRLVAVS
jgi:DNA-directed RNA polymerase specialized sigma subunit